MWTSSILIACLLVASPSSSQQAPIHTPLQTPATQAENLLSALSASTQHTTFIRLLQRSKCVPLLNHIPSATLFAPTDTAWRDWADTNRPSLQGTRTHGWLGPAGLDEWLSDDVAELDNENWALRQHMLYHMFNYTIRPGELRGNDSVTTHTTLLFPLAEAPKPEPIPEPGTPWLPRGGEGMLGGHGQRLRLGAKKGTISLGVDWTGAGGVSVWDGAGWPNKGNRTGNGTELSSRKEPIKSAKWVRNGVVIGLEGVLEPPLSIGPFSFVSHTSALTFRPHHSVQPRLELPSRSTFPTGRSAFAASLVPVHNTTSHSLRPLERCL